MEAAQEYLKPTYFVNSEDATVQEFAQQHTQGLSSSKEKAISLFYAVRDRLRYNPYRISLNMKASDVLAKTDAHCVEKACLLAAACRAVGIPARLGFGTVQNHIGTSKLEEFLGTNVLAFHGYAEIFIEGKWVKATPAFNKALCDKLQVEPLGFDGENHCLFQQYDKNNGRFMEYLKDYGYFADIPLNLFVKTMREYYPHLFDAKLWKNGKLEAGGIEIAINAQELRALAAMQ